MKKIELYLNEETLLMNALNAYWHDANDNLKRTDLGYIEKEQYLIQRTKSKELMQKIDPS